MYVCICLCKNISERIHKRLIALITFGEENGAGARDAREISYSTLLYILNFELCDYLTHSEIKL